MLMTADRPTLTPLGERLLDILKESGEWMTRKEIAAALGRPNDKLAPYDWQVLDALAADDLITVTNRKIGAVRTEYIYKAK